MQKLKVWAKKDKETLISCGIVFLFFLVAFIWKGFWPFGKNSFAVFDLSNQIVPLASLIIDFFQGKASFLYSNRLGCGMNIFASMVYFIMSPLYLLLFLGGRSNMLFMVNFVVVAYFLCMTIAINYMMKKLFKLKSYLQIIISIAYCFCGYVLQNYTFVTWLNFLVILPLLIVSFKRLVDTKKYIWFSILSCMYIVSCFGVGTTTHFVLLAMYYLYVCLCVEKSKRKETLLRLTVALLVGVLFSSVVLIPVGFSAMIGTRTGQLFDYMFTSLVDRGSEIKIMTIMLEFTFTIFNLYFVLLSNKKDKFNVFLSISIVGLLFIHFVDACLLLLNFGLNSGYFTRLGFVYSVITVLSISKLITDFGKTEKSEHQKSVLPNKGNVENSSILSSQQNVDDKDSSLTENEKTQQSKTGTNSKLIQVVTLALCGLTFLFILMTIIYKNKSLGVLAKDVACATLEQQDWKPISFLLFAVLIVFAFIVVMFRIKKINVKCLQISVAILLVCQAVFGGFLFVNNCYPEDRFTVPMKLTSQIDDYDRMQHSVNNSKVLFDTSGISAFTSMLPTKTLDTFSALGYTTKFNFVGNVGGTLFTDSIMGIKYSLTNSPKSTKTHTFVDKDSYTNENGNTITCYLYKYKFATSGAFLLDKDYCWDYSKNTFENQNILAKAMGATDDLFEIYDLHTLVRTGGTINVSTTNLYRSGNEYKTFDDIEGKVNFSASNTAENVYYLLLEDGYDCLYESKYSKNTNPLAVYKVKSGYFNIPKNTSWDFTKIHFAKLNYEKYQTQLENIKNNQVKINYNRNGFKLNVEISQDKKLFVSNINIKGMKAKINSKKVKVFDIATGFVGIDLTAGNNNVEVYYSSPFLLPSILLVLVCIGLAVLVILLYNKGKLNWINKFIDHIYMAYGICFVCVVFVFTGIVTLIKLL